MKLFLMSKNEAKEVGISTFAHRVSDKEVLVDEIELDKKKIEISSLKTIKEVSTKEVETLINKGNLVWQKTRSQQQ